MKVKRTLKMIVGCLLITNLCWAGITQEGDTLPPGVVIHNAPAISHEYIGSPSIVIMPDGTYIASHDYFGKSFRILISIGPGIVVIPGLRSPNWNL